MSYSYIICPSCRARDYPNGMEEFTCTHGCYPCAQTSRADTGLGEG